MHLSSFVFYMLLYVCLHVKVKEFNELSRTVAKCPDLRDRVMKQVPFSKGAWIIVEYDIRAFAFLSFWSILSLDLPTRYKFRQTPIASL